MKLYETGQINLKIEIQIEDGTHTHTQTEIMLRANIYVNGISNANQCNNSTINNPCSDKSADTQTRTYIIPTVKIYVNGT